ncbi:GNAT family N-acetyltransferase [Brevibacterium samyangense]|uniref:GNAT family N-acetyltransferase n=1 Tax=Brevibacterium samyangense TaxID=366888 RepID=A0ABN2TKC0_9MICO
MTEYRFETFDLGVLEDGSPDTHTANYLQAVQLGFNAGRPTDEDLRNRVARARKDGRIATAVYVDDAPAHALDTDIPVATFTHFTKRMHVGGGRLLPAHLITWVTVRPTHRRRGLLRSMMTANLQHAKDEGFPLAALTATEGGIYTRFGFGAGEFYKSIEVDTSPGFRMAVEPDRRVELCSASQLETLEPEIFSKFLLQVPGAIERQEVYTQIASGNLDFATGKEDRKVRAALHYDEDGAVDGFVAYRTPRGEDLPGVVEVVDLVALSDAAYSALWAFLASIDLTSKVTFGHAAAESPLPWLLDDRRRVRTVEEKDGLWIRILDVVAALEARPWYIPGDLVLRVEDPLEHTTGTYRLRADGSGSGRVEPLTDSAGADLVLGVSQLGSMYLGGVDPVVLARAGRITELTSGTAKKARAMFGLERLPHSPNGF